MYETWINDECLGQGKRWSCVTVKSTLGREVCHCCPESLISVELPKGRELRCQIILKVDADNCLSLDSDKAFLLKVPFSRQPSSTELHFRR